jgi:uncharacterized lipoprotein YmbA
VIRSRSGITTFFCFVAALLVACAGSPSPRYYTLSVPVIADAGELPKTACSIAIGPIAIPDIVDRSQLVLRAGLNRVVVLEQHRWAQPLQSEISAVIVTGLTQHLGGAWVADARRSAGRNIDYRVSIDVRRFESLPGEVATVEILWIIHQIADGKVRTGASLAREPASGEDYDELVAAHGRALIAVSRDIAGAIRSLNAEPAVPATNQCSWPLK